MLNDMNGDGSITRDEWLGSDAVFDALDQDHDGLISQADVRKALGCTGTDHGLISDCSAAVKAGDRLAFNPPDCSSKVFRCRREPSRHHACPCQQR